MDINQILLEKIETLEKENKLLKKKLEKYKESEKPEEVDKDFEEQFEEFWTKFDYKKWKWKAKTKFKVALKKVSFIDIIMAVELMHKEYKYKDTQKQYRKQPITWINNECRWDSYQISMSKTVTVEQYKQMKVPKKESWITYENRDKLDNILSGLPF